MKKATLSTRIKALKQGQKVNFVASTGTKSIRAVVFRYKEHLYFLHNDATANGCRPPVEVLKFTKPYKYSWRVAADDRDIKALTELKTIDARIRDLILPKIQPYKVGKYDLFIGKGSVLVGCIEVKNDLVRKIAKSLID